MTKLLLVVANYYPDISKKLLDSSLLAVNKKSSSNTLHDYDVSVINAPGVFEIPVIIAKNINNFDAFIALGCVIKGDTPHFELISRAFTDGIMKLSIEHKKPIGNGVLTCLNKDQALTRIDKGIEATNAVLQVLKNEITR
jgi:6,7-dimethyl-8-ribityllumazine synthase|tara:strand:+ start:2158 stop:2577 length:420 start_codon:yes stop_codon:yes gene_type:complete